MNIFYFWALGIIFVISIGWLIRDNVKHIYELLCALSDDINDIKKKLGLSTENRTPPQIDNSTINFIRKQVFAGKNLKELKKWFGFWRFRKYRAWIDYHRKEYYNTYPRPDRTEDTKKCPNCGKTFDEYDKDCWDCKVALVRNEDAYVDVPINEELKKQYEELERQNSKS